MAKMKYYNKQGQYEILDANNGDTVDGIHFRVNNGVVQYSTNGTSWGNAGAIGTAVKADVLKGKTFSSASGVDQTGSMPDKRGDKSTKTSTNDITGMTFNEDSGGKFGTLSHKLGLEGLVDTTTEVAQNVYGLHPDIIKDGENIGNGSLGLKGKFTSDADATAGQILTGKSAYVKGNKVAGSMPNRGAVSYNMPINGSYTVSEGYHNGSGKVTQSITNYGQKTFTPSRSKQTSGTGYYTGVTVNPVPNNYYQKGDFLPESMTNNHTRRQVWSHTKHTSAVRGVAVDINGNVYSAGQEGAIKKTNKDGVLLWTYTGSNVMRCVAVNRDGSSIYCGGADQAVRKLNSSGGLVWSFTGHTNTVHSVAVDSNGYVYSTGGDNRVKKINSSGGQVWNFGDLTGAGYGVAVNPDPSNSYEKNYVYACAADATVRGINSNGKQAWSMTRHDSIVYGLAVASSGEVYSASSDGTIIRSRGGAFSWRSVPTDRIYYTVATNAQGWIYSGASDGLLRKISGTAGGIWNYPAGGSGAVWSVAVAPWTGNSDGFIYTGGGDYSVRKIESGYTLT